MLRNIKHEILINLSLQQNATYSEIKPEGIENDLYNYHLQHLVKKGFIVKRDKKYTLSDLGKKYIHAEQTLPFHKPIHETFKLGVLLVVIDTENKQILAQKRKRHPHYGSWGIIGGAVQPGEKIIDTARRVLQNETDLIANFDIFGIIRNIKYFQEELFSDAIFYVCITDNFKGDLSASSTYGEHKWVDIETAIANEESSPQRLNSLINVFKLIQQYDTINEIPFTHAEEITHLKAI